MDLSDDSCQCPCCADPSTPYHPVDTMTSNSGVTYTHRDESKGLKTYSRHIQPTWYKDFPWISVCSSTHKIYCSICRDVKSKVMITFSRNSKPAFVENGFQNLKKARERFHDHESSSVHAEAVMKLGAVKSASSGVGALLSRQLENQQKDHRVMLMKLLVQSGTLLGKAYLCVDTMRTMNCLKAVCISYSCCNQKTVLA